MTTLSLCMANIVSAADIIVTVKDGHCVGMVESTAYRCDVGIRGLTSDKTEGDEKTPIGEFPLREIFVREDKIAKKNLRRVSVPIQSLTTKDGWCDDPAYTDYNKYVNLDKVDHVVSYESLYRADDLYNIIIVVGYNDDPIVPGKGSAIFVRVAPEDYSGTGGSIGFSQTDLLRILTKLDAKSKLIVKPQPK